MPTPRLFFDPSQIKRISSGKELKDLKKHLNIALVLVEYRISQLNKGHFSKMSPNEQLSIKARFGLNVKDVVQYEEIRKQLLTISQKLRTSIKAELYTLNTRPELGIFYRDFNPSNKEFYGYTNLANDRYPNFIGLTDKYFSKNNVLGNNTNAGILIHELSHQVRNGGSLDIDQRFYGERGSENLNNILNGNANLRHADSLEFYFEDASQSNYVRNKLGIGNNVPRL